ncbi:MAG: hypothetical protein RQ763_00835 [Sulfurimonas sp.]|uniref:hypothetical protein n=1 Tax=Sulfurimonas sp. TaxID=2022749 RepID=UPI0028CFC83A|nr:hypothetical protein [Sulfurimonas sp.]MDT8337720.1 hypothetical protein [Sulfurimonas sp.]
MLAFTTAIINRLVKYYNINPDEAREMVHDEWDYLEEEYVRGDCAPKDIAKYLISIYMVA